MDEIWYRHKTEDTLGRPLTDVDQIWGEYARMGMGHNTFGRNMISS